MENLPPNSPPVMTVADLEAELAKIKDKSLPVSLVIEFSSQYQDSLRRFIVTTSSFRGGPAKESGLILSGLERLCPEYEEANPEVKK